MKALIYDDFRSEPRVEKVEDPSPTNSGVVIEVKASGLCRSDWHGWMGHDKDIVTPHVPGHEFSGIILEVGRDVQNWKLGDRVTLPFICACGHCQECEEGNQQVCRNQFQPGFTAWGSFAEYVAIEYADVNLVKLPEEMDYVTAASLGCRFATSFRALVDQAKLREDQWVAIHGCGGVGLSAIMIAKALNAQIIAVDIDDHKLSIAKSLGAEYLINANKSHDIIMEIKDFSKGGVQVSMDALGSPETFKNSILALRPKGKHLQVGILPPSLSDQNIPVDQLMYNELEILGSHGMQAHRYPAMMAMIRSGKLNPSKLVENTIGLDDSAKALMEMDNHTHHGITVITKFN